jgi:hypothetical protein
MSGPGNSRRTSNKVKVAWISAGGVVVAALLSVLGVYLTRSSPASPTTIGNVIVNNPPSASPPTQPTFTPATAPVGNLPSGQCANVFSEPLLLQQDILGCVDSGTEVSIYCTAESTSVGGDSVWDLIGYRTAWGVTGYIPDYYVQTGTDNAVMSSCVT